MNAIEWIKKMIRVGLTGVPGAGKTTLSRALAASCRTIPELKHVELVSEYACDLPKNNSKEIVFFNDVFKEMVKLNYPKPRYDFIFHLSPDLIPVNDGIRIKRHFDPRWRAETDIMIKATMAIFKPSHFYIVKQKDLAKRINFCFNTIKRANYGV